ncbi:non-hydrolyzing UDP-N-acetylglucosamine 2-epimerase [Sphingorhabdus contaminans]|uniref:non-hydrolyzing UDP-N-acetylglucosamine 2-epimerase n=1 Tax=Sphingorhabdus contaminans TaxID=1343899 RepID=UPI003D279C41
MPKLKVMTVVGTRPEIIRLSRVIAKLDQYCDHTLVHTGQNYDYELNEIFFSDLGIRRPDRFLEAAGKSAADTIGQVIARTDGVLTDVQPEALLILGDTNSCLAAIAAKRRKIPVFHMEAGNRCFDFRVPEEINRRIVDHTSDINLTYSQIARDYLAAEGFPRDQIICTGSPMREVLEHYQDSIKNSEVLDRLRLQPKGYFLVSSHREENVDDPANLNRLVEILDFLAINYSIPVIVSVHPRTRDRLDRLDKTPHELVQYLKPFGFFDYIKLQTEARCTLSDSGTITEESSILNFPAINLREVHERPEGFEQASVMFTGLNRVRVEQALSILQDQPRGSSRLLGMVDDYQADNVSDKILRIVQSYTDFVNRVVWKKY